MTKGILILVLLLSFSSIKVNAQISPFDIDESQIICFHFEIENYAWGKVHLGCLISRDGNIYKYNNPKHWLVPNDSGYMSLHFMNHNLDKSKLISYKIDSNELKSQIDLIDKAAKGIIKKPVHKSMDAGNKGYYAYIYDKDQKMYKKILLNEYGDFSIENESNEAKILTEWLWDLVNKKTGFYEEE